MLTLAGADTPDAPDVTEPPAQEEFLIIPLRVHVLQADDLPDVRCGLTDDDIQRILGKVNGIWHNAGIHFALESLRREPAENTEKFRLARDLAKDQPASAELFRAIRPRDSRRFDGLHVYYIHQFEVNGIYMGSDYSFVQETSGLRPVEGGIDEPIPRVTAHELGHALGLSHRQNRTNLLASGTTGTRLNRPEVEKARDRAETTPGARTYGELRDAATAAESAGELDNARRLWGWLSEIPGEGAEKAREKVRQLSEPEKSTP
jgi:hypothetical protein